MCYNMSVQRPPEVNDFFQLTGFEQPNSISSLGKLSIQLTANQGKILYSTKSFELVVSFGDAEKRRYQQKLHIKLRSGYRNIYFESPEQVQS